MEKKTAGIIGLIGGILAMVSLALPWMSASITGVVTASFSASGFDAMSLVGYAPTYLLLIGGILALVSGIGMLATKVKVIGYLLPIGGILALVGGIWAFADVASALGGIALVVPGASVGVGYGVYLGIVGGIMALIGSLGLKGE